MSFSHSTPLNPHNYRTQLITVSGILCLLLLLGCLFTLMVWSFFCGEGRLLTCWAAPHKIPYFTYLLLALIRPFTLMPLSFFHMMSSEAFIFQGSIVEGWIMLMTSSVLSFPLVFFMGQYFHHKLARPWLLTHLPRNHKKAQKNSLLLTLMSRSLVMLHYDLWSFFYGILGFKFTPSLRATFYIELIKVTLFTLFTYFTQSPLKGLLYTLIIPTAAVILITIVLQIITIIKGYSWLRRCFDVYHDTYCEIQTNNDIQTKEEFSSKKPPILLLYGFFASRRTLSVMERLLRQKGYDVISFNLGGLFGVFFTHSIIRTAKLVDKRVKRILTHHNLQNIHIVAHSKGGLVASWWALRLGGHKYCKNIITMGTPFGGTYYTWLALITPLGLLWKDVWQMRPRSRFLDALRDSLIPPHLHIHCFYSSNDRITRMNRGIFKPRYGAVEKVVPVAMHHISHFEYLYRKSVVDQIHNILEEDSLRSETTDHTPPS